MGTVPTGLLEHGFALPAYLTWQLETLEQDEQECLEVTDVVVACPLPCALPCSGALLGAVPPARPLWVVWCPLSRSDSSSAPPAWSPSPALGGSWGREFPTVCQVWCLD